MSERKMVPREISQEMLQAVLGRWGGHNLWIEASSVYLIWRAMYDAAPAPPAAPIAQGTDDTTAVMTPFGPMVPPAAPGQPPYPEGNVIGPCVCGSWPGGPCLRCKWIPAPPAPGADAELCARLKTRSVWGKFGWEPDEDVREAAAALEAMQAETARQQHDIDALYDSLQAANVALVAAEARARELEQSLIFCADVLDKYDASDADLDAASSRARAALARKEGER